MPKILGLRTSAFVEIAVFFMLLLPFSDGARFAEVNPHPFWIIVLLAALKYGVNEGLLAAVLATFVLLVGNIPPKPEEQYFWTYIFSLGALPLLWITTALVIGMFRERQIRERDELQAKLKKTQERETKIAEHYSKVKSIKENLERRLAGDFRSSLSIYKAAQAIETLVPAAVINGVSDLISAIMNPEKFSVFLLKGESLNVATRYGWSAKDTYAQSYSPQDAVYREVVEGKRLLVISNEDDEAILKGEGFIAGPIIHPQNGRVIGMLKIEALDFASLNLTSVGSFSALCAWIAMAYTNAEEHQRAKEEGILLPTNLFSQKYFEQQSQYLATLGARAGFDVMLVIVRIVNASKVSKALQDDAERVLGKAVAVALRKSDQACQYRPTASEYSILLPGTDEKGAKIVLGRITDALADHMQGALKKVQFSFSVQPLYLKKKT